jgi:hypothetical protein
MQSKHGQTANQNIEKSNSKVRDYFNLCLDLPHFKLVLRYFLFVIARFFPIFLFEFTIDP